MILYFQLLKNFPQFVVVYTVKGFNVVNQAEVYVFLEFSSFFYGSIEWMDGNGCWQFDLLFLCVF